VAVSVAPDININSKTKVRYVKERILGLEFRPRPDGELLDRFSRWVFQKQEEEQVLHQGRPEGESSETSSGHAARDGEPALVLVSSDADLETRLRDLLKDLPPLTRMPPGSRTMKDLAASGRSLVLYHVPSLSMEDRKRTKLLLEPLAGKAPFVLLGRELDSGAMFELGNEVKAVSVYALGSTATGFFPRLLQGILRKLFT
jgi:hypothetical protein